MSFKDHKVVRGIVISIGILVILLLVFKAGVSVGMHKARFETQFGMNFERNYFGDRTGERRFFISDGRDGQGMGMMGGMNMMWGAEAPGGHGAVGKIVSLALPQFVIEGKDNLEKTVTIGTSTMIRRGQGEIAATALRSDDVVIVLGNPDESGRIEARLIRVMPMMPMMSASSSAPSLR